MKLRHLAATRSALPIGLLSDDYGSQSSRILPECTDNDMEANEFVGSIWHVFNPSLSQCKTAMSTEQKAIDADHAKLLDQKGRAHLGGQSPLRAAYRQPHPRAPER